MLLPGSGAERARFVDPRGRRLRVARPPRRPAPRSPGSSRRGRRRRRARGALADYCDALVAERLGDVDAAVAARRAAARRGRASRSVCRWPAPWRGRIRPGRPTWRATPPAACCGPRWRSTRVWRAPGMLLATLELEDDRPREAIEAAAPRPRAPRRLVGARADAGARLHSARPRLRRGSGAGAAAGPRPAGKPAAAPTRGVRCALLEAQQRRPSSGGSSPRRRASRALVAAAAGRRSAARSPAGTR